jgi:integrase/recombinase XerD
MDGKQIQALLIKEGITPSIVVHRGEQRIKLVFKMDARLTEAVKKLKGRKWSATMRCWHIPKNKVLLEELLHSLTASATQTGKLMPAVKKDAVLIVQPLVEQLPSALPYLQAFTDKIFLKGYSYSTAKIYRSHFNSFLTVALSSNKEIDVLTKQQLENYLRWRQRHKTYSESDIVRATRTCILMH